LANRKTNRKRKDPPKESINEKDELLAKMLGEESTQRPKKKLFNENEKKVVDLLQLMLSSNSNLMHLDLSECGLSADMLLEISRSIKFSMSLIAVHLSGNPGLTQYVKNKIIQRLSASYEKQHNMNSFF